VLLLVLQVLLMLGGASVFNILVVERAAAEGRR